MCVLNVNPCIRECGYESVTLIPGRTTCVIEMQMRQNQIRYVIRPDPDLLQTALQRGVLMVNGKDAGKLLVGLMSDP